jgi:hypothetical protein
LPVREPGSKLDAVTIRATLDYLRANGLDSLVDVYGIHAYPSPHSSAAARLSLLERDTLAECRPPEQGKPCWLTEWGLPAVGAGCTGNDASRAGLVAEMLIDFRQFERQGRLVGLLSYAWTDDKYGLYRCGTLSKSGQLTIDPPTLR